MNKRIKKKKQKQHYIRVTKRIKDRWIKLGVKEWTVTGDREKLKFMFYVITNEYIEKYVK